MRFVSACGRYLFSYLIRLLSKISFALSFAYQRYSARIGHRVSVRIRACDVAPAVYILKPDVDRALADGFQYKILFSVLRIVGEQRKILLIIRIRKSHDALSVKRALPRIARGRVCVQGNRDRILFNAEQCRKRRDYRRESLQPSEKH